VSEAWTLSDLVDEAATRLEALPAPKNGQVRAVPDERTIRYYATIGLLDRPAAMRGRTALYDRRHLAQVVAIKRMQSTGKSLAEIQTLWPTLDEVTLSRMSGVQLGPVKAKSARKDFWKREAELAEADQHATRNQPKAYAPPIPDASMPHRTGYTPAPGAMPPARGATPPIPGAPAAGAMPPARGATPPMTTAIPTAPSGPTITFPAPSPAPTQAAMPAGNVGVALPPPTFTPYAAPYPAPATTTINVPLDGNVSLVIALAEDAAISLNAADVRALCAAAAPLVAELANRGLIPPPKGTLEEKP
jgi:DNA-binding transcriptional MerR regulator